MFFFTSSQESSLGRGVTTEQLEKILDSNVQAMGRTLRDAQVKRVGTKANVLMDLRDECMILQDRVEEAKLLNILKFSGTSELVSTLQVAAFLPGVDQTQVLSYLILALALETDSLPAHAAWKDFVYANKQNNGKVFQHMADFLARYTEQDEFVHRLTRECGHMARLGLGDKQ